MAKPLCYSYSRLSDPRQAAGHGAQRQADYAKRWADEHGITLDETLSLKDEGLSAYHQHHVKRGALGVFLRAVEDGMIPSGSVLIVEGHDRLSRAEPILAQAQLTQIINAGITVVTASDGKEYSRASMKAQPMDLVYSILVMVRANEESETKSKRVTASIRRLCERWMDGSYKGIIRNGKDPQWLRWDGLAWQLIPERVEAVIIALKMYSDGHGATKIVRTLIERGLTMTDAGPGNSSNFYRTIRLRALIGEKEISVGGEQYRLPGYYPAIIGVDQFAEIQAGLGGRTVRKVAQQIPSIITGINVTSCGYCGSAMVGQNLLGRNRMADGRPQAGHRRLCCIKQAKCKVGMSCSVVPVESAIMRFCADQLNLNSLVSGSDSRRPTEARLAAARLKQADIERKIERITTAMLETDSAPAAFLRKASELELELADTKGLAEAAEHELNSAGRTAAPEEAGAWEAVRRAAEALDPDARMQTRKLVASTFSKIVIYTKGVRPDKSDGNEIDLVLVAKRGTSRLLRINRKTGDWIAMEDFSAAA